MDFGALDYSNDQAKVRRRGVVQAAGHQLTLIKIPFHREAQRETLQKHTVLNIFDIKDILLQ